MFYYENDCGVYSSEVKLLDISFAEISQEEYKIRMNKAVSCRTKGISVMDEYDEI